MKFNAELSIWVMAAALCAAAIGTTNAETDQSCVSSLVACLPYLNTTSTPSLLCCIPLKKAIDDQFQCLCDLYKSPEFSGGNATQALTLPARCSIDTDLSQCVSAQPPSPSPSPSPTGMPGTPPTSGPGTPPTSGPKAPTTGPSPSGAEKIIVSSSAVCLAVVIFLSVSIFLN